MGAMLAQATGGLPNVPPGDGHPIDRLLASYFERHNVTPARPLTPQEEHDGEV